MKQRTVTTVKRFAPIAVIAVLLIVLMAAAIVPAARRARSVEVAAENVSGEAVQKLFAADAYARSHEFTTTLDGIIKARVFGVPYSQRVSGGRVVRGDEFTDLAESKSVLVKAGLIRKYENGVYSVAKGKYKKKSFVYDDVKKYDRAGYEAAYGKPCTGLVKYELDGAISEARKNADGSYTYVLDSRRATEFSRNEVKTALGSKSYPTYESVTVILYVDGERPVKATVKEKFRVDKFGGTACTAEYTETFEF